MIQARQEKEEYYVFPSKYNNHPFAIFLSPTVRMTNHEALLKRLEDFIVIKIPKTIDKHCK